MSLLNSSGVYSTSVICGCYDTTFYRSADRPHVLTLSMMSYNTLAELLATPNSCMLGAAWPKYCAPMITANNAYNRILLVDHVITSYNNDISRSDSFIGDEVAAKPARTLVYQWLVLHSPEA